MRTFLSARRWRVPATFLATLVALSAAPAARAAEYDIAQCPQDGRAPEVTPGFITPFNTASIVPCGPGTGFGVVAAGGTVSSATTKGGELGFDVTVPATMPNTKITIFSTFLTLSPMDGPDPSDSYGELATVGADGVRWGTAYGIHQGSDAGFVNQPWHRVNPVGSRTVRTRIQCYGPCHFSSVPTLSFQRAIVRLDDSALPADAVVEPIGLFDGSRQVGKRVVRLAAVDADSGVDVAELRLADGTPLAATPSRAGCTFTRPAPCPQRREQIELSVDTAKLPDGAHTIEAWIRDAAGNVRKTTLPTVVVDNTTPGIGPGAPNGSGGEPRTAAFASPGPPKRLIATFGRPTRIVGKLVDVSGRGIAGASLDVFERLALSGAPSTKVATLTTDSAGSFIFRGTAASSRTVEFAYAERLGSDAYRARLSVEIRVKAKLTFRAARTTVARKTTVAFHGRVRVADLPKRGARVVIEASTGGGWKLGAVVRTRADGTFRWTHAFRVPARYRIRARLLTAADLPARPNTSRALALRVR